MTENAYGVNTSSCVVRVRIYLFIAVLLVVKAVIASDYQKGLDAIGVDDYDTALKEWTPLAEEGNTDAQFGLGYMYLEGKGVAMNYMEAMKWFRLAAEQGDADAQNNLGLMYAVGNGVLEDQGYAHMWFEVASSNGSSGAAKNRNASAETLSPSEVKKAQKLARECIAKNHKGC